MNTLKLVLHCNFNPICAISAPDTPENVSFLKELTAHALKVIDTAVKISNSTNFTNLAVLEAVEAKIQGHPDIICIPVFQKGVLGVVWSGNTYE